MTIERFTREQFEAALPRQSQYVGLVSGEHCYEIPLKGAKIYIRSSIDRTGIARDTADDSIRIFLLDDNNRQLIPEEAKLIDWISRTPGWDRRVNSFIENLNGIYGQLGFCRVCGKLRRPYMVKDKAKANYGRLYAKCGIFAHENPWTWVDKEISEPLSEPEPSKLEVEAVAHDFIPTLYRPTGRDMSEYNEWQMNVIRSMCLGANVVDAGAGAGKTKTVVELVITMFMLGIDPSRVLLVTFSNKAAAEFRERIARAVFPNASEDEIQFLKYPGKKSIADDMIDPFAEPKQSFDRDWVEANPIRKMLVDWACTIHAMSRRLLVANGIKVVTLAGTKHEFTVKSIIKDALDEFKWKVSPKGVSYWIDRAIENHIEPEHSAQFFYDNTQERGAYKMQDGYEELMQEIYIRYMTFMRQHNLYSFAMMQAKVHEMIKKDKGFLDVLSNRFDYVIVDEFQDTDRVQIEILFAVASKVKNFLGVGDTWQSLYTFRGAFPEIMEEEFAKHWETSNRFEMPINYRSAKKIVDITTRLIKNNYVGRESFFKNVMANALNPEGEDPDYLEYNSFKEMCSGMAQELLDRGDFKDWFILSRTRAECAFIQSELIKHRIPCVNISGGSLIGASHIRKVIAYAKLAINYNGARNDAEMLKEVANVASSSFVAPMTRRRHVEGCENEKPWVDCGCPVIMHEGQDFSTMRYYGEKAIDEAGGTWKGIIRQSSERVGVKKLYPSMRAKGATDLIDFVERLSEFAEDALACINVIIDESVMPWLMHEEGADDEDLGENGKTEDFDVLREMIKPGQSLESFLEEVDALYSNNTSEENESAVIGTVHSVKGGERPNVFVNSTRMPIVPPRVKEGELPTSIPNTIEDERRIFYVAVSRAKSKVIVIQSLEWMGKEVKTSQFVYELGFNFDDEGDNDE